MVIKKMFNLDEDHSCASVHYLDGIPLGSPTPSSFAIKYENDNKKFLNRKKILFENMYINYRNIWNKN